MRRVLAPILSVIALGGCVVGPRYQTAATPPTANGGFVSAEPGASTAAPLPPHWWRLYDDATLDSLVERALTENKDLEAAAANLAYAQAQVDEAKAGRYPSTNLSFGPSWGRSPTAAALNFPAAFAWNGGFVASYQVDLFGRIKRTIQAARASAEAEAALEDSTRVSVAAETAGAYAQICGFGLQVATARRNLDVAQQTYDLTVAQRNAGALNDFDVARQAVLVEQARAAVPPLEGQRRAALFALAALTGMTPAEIPPAIGACQAPPTLKQPLPVGDGAALLRRRPDVREAERNLAAATYRIGVATADLYPTITLGGSWGSSADSISGLFSPKNEAYGVGPTSSAVAPLISWNFPNTLIAQAHIHEARAQASAQLAAFDGAVLNALKESETALSTYATEIDHRAALARARDQAELAFDLASKQFKDGSFSSLDLLQAEATAIAAEQALAASDQAIATDQVGVFQALGGGWEDAPKVTPPPIAGVTPKIK